MIKKRHLIGNLVLAVLCGLIMVCGVKAAGTEVYEFLKIPVSARAIGMGEASVAAVQGSASLYHNPAGLLGTSGWELSSHNMFSPDRLRMNNFSAAGRIKGSALGLGVLAVTQPPLQGYDNAGNSTGDFQAYDIGTTLSLAHPLGGTNMGASVKLIRSEIGNARSQGYAVDVGAQRRLSKNLTAGAALLNLGPDATYRNEKAKLPSEARLGGTYSLTNLLLSGDLVYSPARSQMQVRFGAEYQVRAAGGTAFSLRGGYLPDSRTSSGGGLFAQGLRSGLGFAMRSWSLDYAVSPFADLGLNHRISVGFQFGRNSEVK